jgi:hypothetical protein
MPTAVPSTVSAPSLPPCGWRRWHLFEFNDQHWLPEPLRRAMTDYLRTVIELARGFDVLAPRIASALRASGQSHVVDLCSGGAGPYAHLAPAIAAETGQPVRVTLTDLHPNEAAYARLRQRLGETVAYAPRPVDARAVPEELRGVRTIFDGLHHFRPAEARAVLADAARAGAPIVVAEAMQRSVAGVLQALFVPLLVLLVTPLVRPFSLTRLLFTYLVPVLPLLITWDAIVSALRCYRVEELRALSEGLPGDFAWEAGTVRARGATITFLIGLPTVRYRS